MRLKNCTKSGAIADQFNSAVQCCNVESNLWVLSINVFVVIQTKVAALKPVGGVPDNHDQFDGESSIHSADQERHVQVVQTQTVLHSNLHGGISTASSQLHHSFTPHHSAALDVRIQSPAAVPQPALT